MKGDEARGFDFCPSLKQRRVRTAATLLLVLLAAMVYAGITQPFFRRAGDPETLRLAREAMAARRQGTAPSAEAEAARRAAAARILFIGGYWTVCFILSGAVVLLAWIDVREIQRRFAAMRAGALRRQLHQRTSGRPSGGNGSSP